MTQKDLTSLFEAYNDLAEDIIIQAFNDFKDDCDLIVRIEKMRDRCDRAIEKIKNDKDDCLNFFLSEWYEILSQERLKNRDIVGKLEEYERRVMGHEE